MKFQLLQVAAVALLQAFAVHAYEDASFGEKTIKEVAADAVYVTVDVEDLNRCLDSCDKRSSGSTREWERCRSQCEKDDRRPNPRPTPNKTPGRKPTRRPTRQPTRPTGPTGRSCSQGTRDGRQQVRQAWQNNGQNCDNVWGLKDQANLTKDRKFPRTPRNSRDYDYNRCAREGVDDEVSKIEKECLEDDSSQCTELGNAAAEHVVMDNWCTPGSTYGATNKPDYKKECKEAAYSICEGGIPNVANRWCPNKNMSTSKLRELQDKCVKQVNSMVGGNEFVFMEE